MKVEDTRNDHRKSFECSEKDAGQPKENDNQFDGSLRQKDPGDQKFEETQGSTNSNTEATYGQSSPNSSVGADAVIEMKPTTEETALVSKSTDASLSNVTSVSTEKVNLDLSLSQNTSADVEMLSPDSPACKSLPGNRSGEGHDPCTESQAPCAQSSSSVESSNLFALRTEPGTVNDSDVTAMETDNYDVPVSGNSLTANEDSSGSQPQARYMHTCSKVLFCLHVII